MTREEQIEKAFDLLNWCTALRFEAGMPAPTKDEQMSFLRQFQQYTGVVLTKSN